MPEFVPENGDDLRDAALSNERVEEHNALVFEKSVKVGVGVRRALGAVDFVDLGQREVRLRGERLCKRT